MTLMESIIGTGELDADLGVNVGANSYQYDLDTNVPISSVVIEANDYSDSDFTVMNIQYNETTEVPLPDNEDLAVIVSESIPNSEFVIDVNAMDVDGDSITFSITSGNDDGAFSIDSATGTITVNDTSGIDFESATSRTLEITADDGNGGTDTANIVVTIQNENEFSASPHC